MNDEMDAYLRGVLPLLDEEKIAQLLSKGAHVVDKVFDIAQTDERLKEIVQSIYSAGTNQSLIDKLDGNKALADAGFADFAAFYFNCEAKKDELVKLADVKAASNNDPKPYWKRVIENLYWDIPAENVFAVFSGFVHSVLNERSMPGNTDRLEGAYNYLRFQVEKHGVSVADMPEYHAKMEERLPNVIAVSPFGISNGDGKGEIKTLKEAIEAIGKEKNSGYGGVSGSMIFYTGTINTSTGYYTCTFSG